MKITLRSFQGIAPKVAPHLLPDSAATAAVNCRFTGGSLLPWKATSLLGTPLAYPTDTFTDASVLIDASGTADHITVTGHAFVSGEHVQLTTTGTLPAGLALATDYYVGVVSADKITLHSALPVGAGNMVAITAAAGGGTHTITSSWPPYQTIFRYQPDPEDAVIWFGWTDEVQVARGPIPNDWYQRLYYTGNGKPKVLNEAIAATGTPVYPLCFDVGVPSPTQAVTLSVTGTATDSDPTTAITRAAVMTFVNEYGEEGPPSPVSNEVTAYPGQTFHVADMDQDFVAGDNTYVPMDTKRLYFTNTGSSGTEYQFVEVVPEGTDTTDVTYAFTGYGAVLGTDGWVPPPDNMIGIIALPNGSLAGFVKNEQFEGTGNTVCISVPYQPHAWPVAYQFSVAERIVALAPLGNSLLVLTDGVPTIATGADPSALSIDRLEVGYACTSRRGVVDLNGTIIYPCALGLGSVSLGGSKLVTEKLFTEREWASYLPGTIAGYQYNGEYVGFFDSSYSYIHDTGHPKGYPTARATATRGAFIFNPATQQFTTFSEAGVEYTAGAVYDDGNKLALYNYTAGQVRTFEGGSVATLTWTSKPLLTPGDTQFGAIRVYAAAYPASVAIYESGTLKYTATVTSHAPQRLPDTLIGDHWHLVISGTVEVYSVEMASSMEELAQPERG
ncbi:MAG: hypothetical protein P1P84_02660 [Deferrisomatales bacterium]|nr:hypothetical protein [Deferrisomatales bacterium]